MGKKKEMLQYYNRMVCQGMQNKKIKREKEHWEQRAGNHGRKHADTQHTMSRWFPRGTCQQSARWAEAQARIPAAVAPWQG